MQQARSDTYLPSLTLPMTRSIHDNLVLGHSVDVAAKRLIVRTEYHHPELPDERTDVRFEGVLGYLLHDGLGGVLFDIYEVAFEEVLARYADDFERGAPFGWPFQRCDGDPTTFVEQAGARSFLIQSSIGFDGFVICEAMSLDAVGTDES